MPSNVLVTGGAGFIGSNFVRHLLPVDPDVSIVTLDLLTYAGSLSNLAHLSSPHRHQFVQGDIADGRVLSASVKNLPAEFGGCRGYRTRPAAGHRAAVAPRRSQAAQETRATEVGTRMAWVAEG